MDSNVFHLLDALFLPNSPSIYRWRILGRYFKVEESRWAKNPPPGGHVCRAAGHAGRHALPVEGQAGRSLDGVGFQPPLLRMAQIWSGWRFLDWFSPKSLFWGW